MAPKGVAGAPQILQALEGILNGLGSLLGHAKKPDAPAGPSNAGGKVPSELEDIEQQAADLTAGMQKMRDDLTGFGKSIGTIATGVLGAVGYTQIHSIFPFPLGAPGWVSWSTLAAAVFGVAGVTFLVFRFFFARRRILLTASDETQELPKLWWHYIVFWKDEERIASNCELEYADAERWPSLAAVEAEAERLTREARGKTGDAAKKEWAEAYRLDKVVDLGLTGASYMLLERRTRGAYGGPVAAIALICGIGGIGFVFGVADWAKGQRSLPQQRVREAQVCVARAEASKDPLIRALRSACIAKAKADLSATTTTATTTAPVTTTTGK
ncbi:MAG TPA: hypothetical protein VFM96_04375 [Gaiellaceae bacterium]|nr:hypothetical protein [Gaiellaceae bacterium]